MDRAQLFNALSNLPPQDFERLLFAIKPPGGLIPGDTAPQMNRVKALLEWAEGSSGRGTDEIWDYLEQATTDFGAYLASLIATYEKWWDFYRLTEAISVRQATFTFEQSAQTEERSKEDPIKKEPVLLPQLLQGIIDYAESEPVLLVGSPGMGKSTTLLRLLAVLAKQELQKSAPRIPVLVRLKDYQSSLSSPEDISGMLALIKEALEPELILEISEVKTLLFQDKRLFLLLDGLNEMPADVARNKLINFRDQCKRAKIPLICTTRSLGEDFSIQRRVDLQPLSPKEIHRFLSECMPGQEQQVLQLLNKGNQELGKTPFVLWMLYDVYRSSGQVSESLGEAFSRFTKNYTNYKINQEGIPHSPETLQNWSLSLEYLAFEMLKSPDPQDPGLIIAERQAANVLTQFPSKNAINLVQAQALLNNLLEYHLLQKSHKGEVSFCHQLIQEYYAAEHLLRLLPELSDEQLKRDYLNLLKWTEPIALMLALLDEEKQALRVVKLAMEDVDLMLGARLAGRVNPRSQEESVKFINNLALPKWLKIDLLGETRIVAAIPYLFQALKNEEPNNIYLRVEEALEKLDSAAIPSLYEVLENENFNVRMCVSAKNVLDKMIIESCLRALENIDPNVRADGIETLRILNSEIAVTGLLKALEHRNPFVRASAVEALGNLKAEAAIPSLLYFTKYEDRTVQISAENALKKMGLETAIPDLLQELENEIPEIEKRAKNMPPIIEEPGADVALPDLFQILEDENLNVRWNVVKMLGILESEEAITALVRVLENKPVIVDVGTVEIVGKLRSKKAIPYFLRALEMIKIPGVRSVMAKALGNMAEDSSASTLPHLRTLLPTHSGKDAFGALIAIQASCKFYNYEIWQESVQSSKLEIQKVDRGDAPENKINNFPNATEVKIYEWVEHYHEHPPDSNL
jgi:HEAT repeat protein/energy-coupling factor transporter ATP-binding protein EcfA2